MASTNSEVLKMRLFSFLHTLWMILNFGLHLKISTALQCYNCDSDECLTTSTKQCPDDNSYCLALTGKSDGKLYRTCLSNNIEYKCLNEISTNGCHEDFRRITDPDKISRYNECMGKEEEAPVNVTIPIIEAAAGGQYCLCQSDLCNTKKFAKYGNGGKLKWNPHYRRQALRCYTCLQLEDTDKPCLETMECSPATTHGCSSLKIPSLINAKSCLSKDQVNCLSTVGLAEPTECLTLEGGSYQLDAVATCLNNVGNETFRNFKNRARSSSSEQVTFCKCTGDLCNNDLALKCYGCRNVDCFDTIKGVCPPNSRYCSSFVDKTDGKYYSSCYSQTPEIKCIQELAVDGCIENLQDPETSLRLNNCLNGRTFADVSRIGRGLKESVSFHPGRFCLCEGDFCNTEEFARGEGYSIGNRLNYSNFLCVLLGVAATGYLMM